MKNNIIILFIATFLFTSLVWANSVATHRATLLSNDKVNVWKTFIYPAKNQQLKMHRHEYDRVLIALDNGTLKVVNDKGQSHLLKLSKDQAYFLNKDIPGELHTDENLSGHVIKVIVVELKSI